MAMVNFPLLRTLSIRVILLILVFSFGGCGNLASSIGSPVDIPPTTAKNNPPSPETPSDQPTNVPPPSDIPFDGGIPVLNPEEMVVTLSPEGITLEGLPGSVLGDGDLVLCEVAQSETQCLAENPSLILYETQDDASFDPVTFVMNNPKNDLLVTIQEGSRMRRALYLRLPDDDSESAAVYRWILKFSNDDVLTESQRCIGRSGEVCKLHLFPARLLPVCTSENLGTDCLHTEGFKPMPKLPDIRPLPDMQPLTPLEQSPVKVKIKRF